jgi:hypothetical protein
MANPAACNGGITMCDRGVAPASYLTLPINRVLGQKGPFSNMNDIIPMVNLVTHATCLMGMPKPCIPSTVVPFIPTPTVLIGSAPAFKWSASATCAMTGSIKGIMPHQPTVMLA